jgi:hypothetical protein
MHILAPNQTPQTYPYSVRQLRRDNPQVSFPENPTEGLLAAYDVYPVQPTDSPAGDVVTEVDPVLTDGQWLQAWSVRDFTPEEIADNLAARRAEMVVTPRQARLALLSAGRLGDIEAAIAALDAPTRAAVEIEWEYAVLIERTSPWVVAMTQALGMTDTEVDALFTVAAGI